MAESCPYHTEHERRINKLEETCDKLDDRITQTEQSQAVMIERIANSLDHLSRLPEAIDTLKDTNMKLENKVDKVDMKVNGLRTDFDGLKTDVKVINEEGKFNIRTFIKNNWFYMSLVVLILIYFGKDVVAWVLSR